MADVQLPSSAPMPTPASSRTSRRSSTRKVSPNTKSPSVATVLVSFGLLSCATAPTRRAARRSISRSSKRPRVLRASNALSVLEWKSGGIVGNSGSEPPRLEAPSPGVLPLRSVCYVTRSGLRITPDYLRILVFDIPLCLKRYHVYPILFFLFGNWSFSSSILVLFSVHFDHHMHFTPLSYFQIHC